jgi:hypothetical protein
MKLSKVQQRWIDTIISQNLIQEFDTGLGVYYRVTPDSTFQVSKDQVLELQKTYDPSIEKGGFFFVELQERDNKRYLTTSSIRWLPNVHDSPSNTYLPDLNEYRTALLDCLTSNLLPFFFHTHPTKTVNPGFESILYLRNMDTSDADKRSSLLSLSLGNVDFRVPELLIVGNGINDLFIGFYSGLISPLNFDGRKSELVGDLTDKIVGYFDTPKKRLFAGLSALALLILFIEKPKAILPSTLVVGTVLPSLAYKTANRNILFGIADSKSIEIYIPPIEDSVIIANEKKIHEIPKN